MEMKSDKCSCITETSANDLGYLFQTASHIFLELSSKYKSGQISKEMYRGLAVGYLAAMKETVDALLSGASEE